MTTLHDKYTSLTKAGFVCLTNRTLVRISGEDRKTFLHSFCTADVKALDTGQATEAFILNDKGKILSHVLLLAIEDCLLLTGAGDQATTIIDHLDKYIIRDDVQLVNQSDSHAQTFVCGSDASVRIEPILSATLDQNQIIETQVDGYQLVAAHVEVAGFGQLLIIETANQDSLELKLQAANIAESDELALHIVRIENETPWFGVDVDDRNLPQELQRDEKAISFNKGCYLGQETVARIDAIGHVNQWLVGLAFSGPKEDVTVDSELFAGEKKVGRVTSISPTADGSGTIGLGFLRRMHAKAGAELSLQNSTATVTKRAE